MDEYLYSFDREIKNKKRKAEQDYDRRIEEREKNYNILDNRQQSSTKPSLDFSDLPQVYSLNETTNLYKRIQNRELGKEKQHLNQYTTYKNDKVLSFPDPLNLRNVHSSVRNAALNSLTEEIRNKIINLPHVGKYASYKTYDEQSGRIRTIIGQISREVSYDRDTHQIYYKFISRAIEDKHALEIAQDARYNYGTDSTQTTKLISTDYPYLTAIDDPEIPGDHFNRTYHAFQNFYLGPYVDPNAELNQQAFLYKREKNWKGFH